MAYPYSYNSAVPIPFIRRARLENENEEKTLMLVIFMACSVGLPSSFSSPPPPRLSSPRSTLRTLAASSLPSPPKPRTRRKNHLRPRLPKPNLTPPPPQPSVVETLATQLLVFEEVDSTEELIQESTQESIHELSAPVAPLPQAAAPHWWHPGPVLHLSLRFAALLAVQTAVAVWFLGLGQTEERTDGEAPEEEEVRVVEKEGKEEELSEFHKMVLEIREMAKEAREKEAKENAEGSGEGVRRIVLKGFMDEKAATLKGLEEKKGGGKVGSRRRTLGFVGLNAKSWNIPKGFDASKDGKARSNGVVNGGIQQIASQNPGVESPMLHEAMKTGDSGPSDSPFGNVSNVHTSAQNVVEGLKSGDDTSKSTSSGRRFRRGSRSSEKYVQTGISADFASTENNSFQGDALIEQSFIKESQTLTNLSNMSGESATGLRSKEAESNLVVNRHKDSRFGSSNQPWWLKLSFVLAIFLHRGSEHSSSKGLYSLKMDSPSDNGHFTSYTIAFEDRSDATNFCYILESFFEDLGDFSADIVPLTIQVVSCFMDKLSSLETCGFFDIDHLKNSPGQALFIALMMESNP